MPLRHVALAGIDPLLARDARPVVLCDLGCDAVVVGARVCRVALRRREGDDVLEIRVPCAIRPPARRDLHLRALREADRLRLGRARLEGRRALAVLGQAHRPVLRHLLEEIYVPALEDDAVAVDVHQQELPAVRRRADSRHLLRRLRRHVAVRRGPAVLVPRAGLHALEGRHLHAGERALPEAVLARRALVAVSAEGDGVRIVLEDRPRRAVRRGLALRDDRVLDRLVLDVEERLRAVETVRGEEFPQPRDVLAPAGYLALVAAPPVPVLAHREVRHHEVVALHRLAHDRRPRLLQRLLVDPPAPVGRDVARRDVLPRISPRDVRVPEVLDLVVAVYEHLLDRLSVRAASVREGVEPDLPEGAEPRVPSKLDHVAADGHGVGLSRVEEAVGLAEPLDLAAAVLLLGLDVDVGQEAHDQLGPLGPGDCGQRQQRQRARQRISRLHGISLLDRLCVLHVCAPCPTPRQIIGIQSRGTVGFAFSWRASSSAAALSAGRRTS